MNDKLDRKQGEGEKGGVDDHNEKLYGDAQLNDKHGTDNYINSPNSLSSSDPSAPSYDSPNLESKGLKPQRRLFSWLYSKKIPPVPTADERVDYPEPTANIISRLSFWWVLPVLKRGYKRTLDPDDLFTIPKNLEVAPIADKFEKNFEKALQKARANYVEKVKKELKQGKKIEKKGIANTVKDEDESSVDDIKNVEYLDISSSDEEILSTFTLSPWTSVKALLLTFKWQYTYATICLAIGEGGAATSPLLIRKLISSVERRTLGLESMGPGVGYAIATSVVTFLIGILYNQFFYFAMLTGAQSKSVLTRALLRKSFRLNAELRHKFPVGKITSIMGTDCARVDFALGFQPFALAFPVPFVISIALLIYNIGVSALVGIGVLLVFIVLIGAATGQLFAYRSKTNSFTDKRVNLVKEVLNNLKMIKFYSWEGAYGSRIAKVRNEEMRLIFNMQILRNILIALAMSLTGFASMAAFLVVYRLQGNRNPANIFSSISLFNMLSLQVIFLPMALATGSDGLLGMGRVGNVLAAKEITNAKLVTYEPEDVEEHERKYVISQPNEDHIAQDQKDSISDEQLLSSLPIAISAKDATFEWETFDLGDEDDEVEKKEKEKKKKKKLKKQEKDLKRGKLLEKKATGDLEANIEGSLPNKQVLDSEKPLPENAFSLSFSLDIPTSSLTIVTGSIGSGKSSFLAALAGFMARTRGSLSISGSLVLCGQPWIQNATLRDNILFGSAFDADRYQKVLRYCSLESDLEILPAGDQTEVGERGITLSGGQKARISLARAAYADKDIVLLDDVLSAVDAKVGRNIMNNCILGLMKKKTVVLATHQLSLIGSADKVIFLNGDGSIHEGTLDELRANNAAFANLMKYGDTKEKNDDEEEEEEEEMVKAREPTSDGRLMEDEEKAENQIAADVYVKYITIGAGKRGKYPMVPAFILCMLLSTFCSIFSNTWLSFWGEMRFDRSNHFYISFYVVFTVLAFVFLAIQFLILVYVTNSASVRMNVRAMGRVLHAPMYFMDTTPMGRILNRFTKDTDVLDNEICDQFSFLVHLFCNIMGTLILCIIYMPWFAIAVPFLGTLFVAVANYYQASARELKRLEAIHRSVVYNNFNETLNGMDTIKGYGHEYRFLAKNDVLLNRMNEAYFLTLAAQRWLTVMLDLLASCFTILIALLCAGRVFNISASSTGLILAYVYEMSAALSMLLKTFTQVENEMNACERVLEYAFKVPQEEPYIITETETPKSWPQGQIKFSDVSMRYRDGLPLVLKGLNFDVKAGEKIGICGRTGAGKSSIMNALFRLNELDIGKILIDGVDISTLGLHNLRKHLAIIPQDPVLFRGTMRKNLDPFDDSEDSVLEDALQRTGLSFLLTQLVDDDGSNFSLGERQLIAFARALVRNSQILIMDEATSSVDYETDMKIQQTIAREFSKCTILCIAHRLRTIVKYDRILVLDKGEKVEMGSPKELYEQKGQFWDMCQRSNIDENDM